MPTFNQLVRQGRTSKTYKSVAPVLQTGFNSLKNIRIRGVMGMATLTDDEAVIRADFERLRACKAELAPYFDDSFDTLSMGMSDDYPIALEYDTTEVRIGSTIFGSRTI